MTRWHVMAGILCGLSLGMASASGTSPAAAASRTIMVCGDRDYPPYEFLEQGQAQGFNIDLIRAVARVTGLRVEIRLMPWAVARTQLERGEIDALTGMYHTPEREQRVDFSSPHTVISHDLFVRNESLIHSLEEAKDKEIIVQEGDIMHDYLLASGLTHRVVLVKDASEVVRCLSEGQCDAALLSRIQGNYYARKSGFHNIKPVGAEIRPQQYCIAVAKGNDALRRKLNEGLYILKTSGEYQRIHRRWLGEYEAESFWPMVKKALWGLVGVSALLLIALGWVWALRREVGRNTEALRQAHAEMEQVVRARTAELAEANALLMRQLNERGRLEAEIKRLAGRLLDIQETERKKISADLHDNLGQLLALARLEMAAVHPADDASCQEKEKTLELLNTALGFVRKLAQSLRPTYLEDMDFHCAIETLFADFETGAGIKITLNCEGPTGLIGRDHYVCLYRVIQESLTNVVRHASASSVQIRLGVKNRRVQLEIQDDGKGFAPASMPAGAGIGLVGMRERLSQCGGELRILSHPGQGATVLATIPLAASTPSEASL